MSDVEDPIDARSDAGDDLFGDGDDDAIVSDIASEHPRSRSHSRPHDAALSEDNRAAQEDGDEDDDQSRRNRSYGQRDRSDTEQRVVLEMALYRHALPKPEDGEIRSFRVPPFLKVNPHTYESESFAPSEWDIENARSSHPKHVIRYRINRSTGMPESNTLLHRWSDGSITISVGGEHFEIQRKNLAPLPGHLYDQLKDAHYYAAAAHLSSNSLVTVGHITEQFIVKPNSSVEDDGIATFKDLMAKQRAARMAPTVDAEAIKLTQVDPEQMKRELELAERERAKAQRRRENAQARQGAYGSRSGGLLSIDGVERVGSGRAGGKKRGAAGSSKRRPYRDDYDSDDEPGARRRGENYNYDDFVVRSEDELSEMDDEEDEDEDDEEEEILDDEEERRERRHRKKRQKTAEAESEDAENEVDDEPPLSAAPADHVRGRRRKVVDDDDDE